MGERARTRALVVARALATRLRPRAAGSEVRSALIAHNLLLGDTFMLTPLLAKVRAVHPAAAVTLLAPPAAVALYERRPYGVRVLPFRPSDSSTARALVDSGPYDLGLVVGDNRYSWLAAAMGARHTVGHASGRSSPREWMLDEKRVYSQVPAAWGDMVAQLVDGPPPPPYSRNAWEAPSCREFDRPAGPYAVLHVGGSTPLKHWVPERWAALANALGELGITTAWSAGPGEEALVAAADPASRHASYAGRLDLAQMWHLVAGSRLLVSPDTGIAHLGRATWTPTITLFGPGSATLAGSGDFWRDTPWQAVGRDPFPCRDQRLLFGREVDWVRRCGRTIGECPAPRCMHAIEVDEVVAAAQALMRST